MPNMCIREEWESCGRGAIPTRSRCGVRGVYIRGEGEVWVKDTCYSENSESAASPHFVLTQQEWQQHEEASIMDHPPDVNAAFTPVLVAREPVDAFGDQDGQLPPGGHTNALYIRTRTHIHTPCDVATEEDVGTGGLPMNSFQDWDFLQLSGQPMTTVLCFIPPSPAF